MSFSALVVVGDKKTVELDLEGNATEVSDAKE